MDFRVLLLLALPVSPSGWSAVSGSPGPRLGTPPAWPALSIVAARAWAGGQDLAARESAGREVAIQEAMFQDTTEQALDAWFGEDKLRHFFLSFAATSLAYGAVRSTGAGHTASAIAAGAGAAAAGVWKEFHDRGRGRPFSRRDLVWDGLGILAGLVLAAQTR